MDRYEEAMSRCKQWEREHTSGYVIQDMIEFIFPELRESEDERTRKSIIAFLQAQKYVPTNQVDRLNGWIAWLEKQKEQQPVEWSEEDKYILKNIHDFIKENTINPNRVNCAEECLNWLNSLPERFNLHPIQEWSEEDERLLNIIIDILDREEHNGHLSHDDLKNCVKLIKSIRPQPHWKPSEEQMKALLRAVDDLQGKPYWGYINEVVCDIRDKLM